MKDPLKLQTKLVEALRNHSGLRVSVKVPCTLEEFREIAWVVEDYVIHSGDVTNDDPLHEWLEEYRFMIHQHKS